MPLGVLSLSRLKINVREMRWLFLTPSKSKSYNRPEFIRNHQLRGLETITADDPSFVRRTRSHISISGTQIHLVLSTLVLKHYILTFELWTVNGAHMVFPIFLEDPLYVSIHDAGERQCKLYATAAAEGQDSEKLRRR